MSLQYVDYVLRNNWEPSITDRPHDVGDIGNEIRIVEESDIDWRQMDLANYDYLTLQDGGTVDISPKSVDWQEEDRVSRVDVDIRTRGHLDSNRPGRIALYGERGAGSLNDNESPRWGGLVGETERVLKSVRDGDKEFTITNVDTVDDLSTQMGGQIWRAVVQIRLEVRSSQIDTSV